MPTKKTPTTSSNIAAIDNLAASLASAAYDTEQNEEVLKNENPVKIENTDVNIAAPIEKPKVKAVLKIIGNDYSFTKYSGKGDAEEFLNQFKLKELELDDAQIFALVEVNTTHLANK